MDGLMDNASLQVLVGAVVGLIVTVLGFLGAFLVLKTAQLRHRANTVEQDAARERQQRERDDEFKTQLNALQLKVKEVELKAKDDELANTKAVRDSMLFNMKRVEALEAKTETLGSQYNEAKVMIDTLQDDRDDLQAQLIQRDRESERRDAELKSLQARVTATETERENLLKVIAQKDKEIEALKLVAQKDITERDTLISQLTEKVKVMERELLDLRTELDQLKAAAPSPDITPDNGEPPPQASGEIAA